jgi:SnoaL-like domain
MSAQAPAITVANAHIEGWSNHDFDSARASLADDVRVAVTSTNSMLPETRTSGIDDYMTGLITFAQAVVPGSARVLSAIGDERNALIMLTVRAAFPPSGQEVTLPGARLYLLDGSDKIASEQVIFYLAES